MTEFIAVFVTARDEDEAALIARSLVEKRLAACASIIRGIRSVYRWEGAVHDDQEALLVIKTSRSLFDGLEAEVRRLHSYTTPEIIAVPLVAGSPSYLQWLEATVASPE